MEKTRQTYSSPASRTFSVAPKRCIATSAMDVTGTTEKFSNRDYQTESFSFHDQGDF